MRRIALDLAAIALGVVFCELILAVAAALSPMVAFRLQPPELRLKLDGGELVVPREVVPDPVLGHRRSQYTGRFDKWGYRNPAVPESCVLLALGDSMTLGHDVAAIEAWPHVLSRLGRFCVYNAGMGGYGPAEYQVVLGETLPLRPRLVVVGLFLGNDVHDAFRSAYLRADEPFKHLRSSDPAVVAQLQQLERQESLRARALRLLGRPIELEAPAPQESGGLRQWLARKSRLYALAREAKNVLQAAWHEARGGAPVLPPGEKNVDTFEASAAQPHRVPWARDPRFRTVFARPEVIALSMDLDDSRIREGQRITESVLVAIRDRLARERVDFLVLIIPTKESAYATFFEPEQDDLPASMYSLLAIEKRLREEIIAFLKDSAIAYIDVLPALRASFAGGVALYNQSHDFHPTAAGHEAVARALLPVVQQRLAASGASTDQGADSGSASAMSRVSAGIISASASR
jgi:hypothetical protein